ncbi:MAG: cob(I)yrinic acid a,c-diamide adenosyltransferase [Pseudanabaenaceae cyanobacterium bins.68]|nr:cob(I)yrinic acid a,c-diamide adenosyltransferase [Pseudanabaenaceae cyanobacterium bins.68]
MATQTIKPANLTAKSRSNPNLSLASIAPGSLQIFSTIQPSFPLAQIAQALRVASLGTPALVVQFFQGGINQGVEQPRILGQNLTWVRSQIQRRLDQDSQLSPAEIDQILSLWTFTKTAIASLDYGLILLDQLSLAISLDLIPQTEIIQQLSDRPPALDLILTGTQIPIPLLELADQVTHRRN